MFQNEVYLLPRMTRSFKKIKLIQLGTTCPLPVPDASPTVSHSIKVSSTAEQVYSFAAGRTGGARQLAALSRAAVGPGARTTLLLLLLLLDDGGDLGHQGGVDQGAEVEGADALDEAELEDLEVQAGQVDGGVAEDAELLELEQGLQLLELEDVVDAEGGGREEGLEGEGVEVVVDGELLEQVHVERVDGVQVAQVQRVEGQVVERAGVEGAALLGGGRQVVVGGGGGGGGGGDGGQGTSEDGGELHFDIRELEEHSSSSGMYMGILKRSESNNEHSCEERVSDQYCLGRRIDDKLPTSE